MDDRELLIEAYSDNGVPRCNHCNAAYPDAGNHTPSCPWLLRYRASQSVGDDQKENE